MSHCRVKPYSFPVAAKALIQRVWWGEKHFRTCRNPQGSPGAEDTMQLHSMMHAVITSLLHQQSSFSGARTFTHHNGVVVWLQNFWEGTKFLQICIMSLPQAAITLTLHQGNNKGLLLTGTQLPSGTWLSNVVMQTTSWGPARGIWQWCSGCNIPVGYQHYRYTWNSSKVQENGVLNLCWEH